MSSLHNVYSYLYWKLAFLLKGHSIVRISSRCSTRNKLLFHQRPSSAACHVNSCKWIRFRWHPRMWAASSAPYRLEMLFIYVFAVSMYTHSLSIGKLSLDLLMYIQQTQAQCIVWTPRSLFYCVSLRRQKPLCNAHRLSLGACSKQRSKPSDGMCGCTLPAAWNALSVARSFRPFQLLASTGRPGRAWGRLLGRIE